MNSSHIQAMKMKHKAFTIGIIIIEARYRQPENAIIEELLNYLAIAESWL